MNETNLPKLFLLGVAATSLAIGVYGAASASTDTTEPIGSEPAHTEAGHTMETTPATLAADGSAEASSPEAEAFCSAEMAVEAAVNSEDPAAIGPAIEALTAAAPADVAPAVETVLATFEEAGPEFNEAYGALIDWMRANCGFAELNATASEYVFGGVPTDLPAGPIIVSLENIGEELHVIEVVRVNDDVTLTTDELLALPEEEALTMITMVGSAFADPGTTGYGVMDLTPGRYLALCPIPQGLTPEVAAQFEEPEGSAPVGSAPVGSAPVGSAPVGSAPVGSAPEGSAPGPELGPPHFVLGMVQEFTVA
jgi:hypothetical protein